MQQLLSYLLKQSFCSMFAWVACRMSHKWTLYLSYAWAFYRVYHKQTFCHIEWKSSKHSTWRLLNSQTRLHKSNNLSLKDWLNHMLTIVSSKPGFTYPTIFHLEAGSTICQPLSLAQSPSPPQLIAPMLNLEEQLKLCITSVSRV